MAVYGSGSATMDDRMVLRKADDIFYQFIGPDIYAPVTHRIHPDDTSKFTDAVAAVKTQQLSQNYVSVRVKDTDDIYQWVTLEISQEPFLLDGKQLFHLNLTTIASASDSKLMNTAYTYEVLLGLLGGMLLTYSSETDIIQIYTICNGQQLPIYQGLLEEWQKLFLKEKLDPDSFPDFQAMCLNIQEGQSRFKHNILCNAFSQNASMELCSFQCQTLKDDDGRFKVLGCITIYGKDKRRMPETEYNMDTTIPILNKKAITDYAKKTFMSSKDQIYLTVMDLDNFKTINDTYGHFFGDEVLNTVAEIIKKTLGNAGVVGRIGGDEMMLVLNGIENQTELRNLLRAIRTNIEWAYKGTRDDLRITCSMGVATFPDHGTTFEQLFQIADRMLYIAKKKGKNRYIIYIPEIHDSQTTEDTTTVSGTPAVPPKGKTEVMQRLIEDFLLRKVVVYKQIMHELTSCFDLDEIIMVYGNMMVATYWDRNSATSDLNDTVLFKPDEGFLSGFDSHGCFVCNSVFNLEVTAPELFSYLRERGTESVFFYRMAKHDKMFGYMIFSRKTRRQMWSEHEKSLLALTGKVFEQSMIQQK